MSFAVAGQYFLLLTIRVLPSLEGIKGWVSCPEMGLQGDGYEFRSITPFAQAGAHPCREPFTSFTKLQMQRSGECKYNVGEKRDKWRKADRSSTATTAERRNWTISLGAEQGPQHYKCCGAALHFENVHNWKLVLQGKSKVKGGGSKREGLSNFEHLFGVGGWVLGAGCWLLAVRSHKLHAAC